MKSSIQGGRRSWMSVCGALAILLGGGALIGMGCGNGPPIDGMATPPLSGQDIETDLCECYLGYYYNNDPIPPSNTRCDVFHCGRDLIAYECIDYGTSDNWRSYPGNRCGDLACPAEGKFCGEDVVNGEPAALYECPGVGQIPLEWQVCTAGCHNGACTGAPSNKCPCEQPHIAGDDHIQPRCGLDLCFPTGAGDAGVRKVCSAEGWRNLGLSCAQRQGTCNACRGVQDSFGDEVLTTACGERMCGLGIGNRSLWACGEEGWLDLNIPCDPNEVKEAEASLGRCPAAFPDNDGQWKPVEQGQTFCGDQGFHGPDNNALAESLGEREIRIGGTSTELFACPFAGARPVPYRSCSALGGSGECKRVHQLPPMHYHEATGTQPAADAPEIRDWDRCDQSCISRADAHYQFVTGGNNGDNDCRHLFCGQHEITGRVGTLYRCAYDTWDSCPPPASSASAQVGRPVPYEQCAAGCAALNLKSSNDVCDASVEQIPFGVEDPAPSSNLATRCDPIADYQGTPVPPSSLRQGSQICGPGGQVFECRERQLSRPDGWHAMGISCGTPCGVCGPDPYGSQVPVCEFITDALDITCTGRTPPPASFKCNDDPAVTANAPAYCGYNSDLGTIGDPSMLYVCKAYCPRGEGAARTLVPCEGQEGLGGNGKARTRVYKLDRSVYCPLGCQINEVKNDECKVPVGGRFQFPFPDHVMGQNLGHMLTSYGGTHLAEDIVKATGATAGEYVHSIGDGTLLWAGYNCSWYLGAALVEHRFKKDGVDQRYCSFYGHLDTDELAIDLVGQHVSTATVLGKVVYWDDIPSKHNAVGCPSTYEECPGSTNFTCDPTNSHLHYVVLSDAECASFDAQCTGAACSSGAPPGYDECDVDEGVSHKGEEDRMETYTARALDCDTTISTTSGYISPEWFIPTMSR